MSRELEDDESQYDDTRAVVSDGASRESRHSHDGSEDRALERMMRAAKPSSVAHAAVFADGTRLQDGRFEIVRRLGSGAMGTVYEARDRGARIALKTLNNLNPDQLYRLKREFRFLTEVVHPNVVVVYELLFEDESWFYTMECVRGMQLDRYWAVHRAREGEDASKLAESDLTLLRSLIRQIIDGVCAIHAAGLLHRDLKPTNMLVEPDGRVVILDFGLVSGQLAGGVGQTIAHQISGTPGFMSPEQAMGAPASTASDWYAVGVILYLLLTRRLPHQGTLEEVLRAKQSEPIRPARELVPELPPELDALCSVLLARDPVARPSTAQMVALRNELAARDAGRPSAVLSARAEPGFVGRSAPLAQLDALYAEPEKWPVFALVRGASGIGKSELLRAFTGAPARLDDPFIVRGRCYEGEAVPYKALDEAIDDLTRILVRLPDEQAHQLVPRHAQTLTRLFPVLQRVPAFRDAVGGREGASEGRLQRLGSGALRELLGRIADRRPLLLLLEDLQWSDVDSLRLLGDALAPPDAPNLLVIGTCRSPCDAPALDELLALPGLRSVTIELEPLTHAQAVELALSALPSETPLPYDAAERIARESRGSPLYVLELAGAEGDRVEQLGAESLDWLIQQRVAALGADAREVLELTALTGRPLPREVLVRASGQLSYPTALAALRANKLVHRTFASSREEALEPYHDRVRAAVLAQLEPGRAARHHETLARALADTEHAEPEWLAQHLRGAGRASEAHHYALEAAHKAMQALAFNRAADLFALSLELSGGDHASPLHREHAVALACAGRGGEAADAYLRAAQTASPEEATRLEGLAAAQRLRVGHVEQAVVLLRHVLARNELPWPETIAECIARFVLNRARIRLSGLKFRVRDERDVPRALLDKIDALYPAQTVLGTFDYWRGACFASMALPLALEAGEPKRLVTALASEAVYGVMLDGAAGSARARGIEETVDALSSDMQDPYGTAVTELSSALCAYWSGRWSRVVAPALKAEHVFGQDVSDGTWEAALVRSVRHTVEIHGGGLPTLARTVPSGLVDASERNDRYAQLDLMRTMVVVHLREDRVDEARAVMRDMELLMARFPVVSLHHLVLAVNVALELYVGDGARARAQLNTRWETCRKSQLHRLPLLRAMHLGTLADCALADRALSPRQRADELTTIARLARKESVEWAPALSLHLCAEAALLRGQRERATRSFEEAHDAYAGTGHALAAACVRASQSGCAPARRAEELAEQARAFFAEQGIVRPERWRAMVHTVA